MWSLHAPLVRLEALARFAWLCYRILFEMTCYAISIKWHGCLLNQVRQTRSQFPLQASVQPNNPYASQQKCVCVRESVCVCVCVSERECVCVCVRERERERVEACIFLCMFLLIKSTAVIVSVLIQASSSVKSFVMLIFITYLASPWNYNQKSPTETVQFFSRSGIFIGSVIFPFLFSLKKKKN